MSCRARVTCRCGNQIPLILVDAPAIFRWLHRYSPTYAKACWVPSERYLSSGCDARPGRRIESQIHVRRLHLWEFV